MLDLTASSCPRCGAGLSSSDSSAGLCPACLLLTALPHSDGARDTISTLAPGTDVGPFRIVRLLGRGGMATVYEAVESQLDRSVALKVLPPEFLHEQTFARRFDQEARVVAKLEHQHIVPIFAAGIDDGIPWMSTRLMAGGNLAARLARGGLEPADGLRVLRHVAEALDYAHARGVVHRDVKPANILLDAEGQVYLADFGLALMLEGGTRLSHGVLTGTPHYMSPEQALGQSADHRSDIYSLAIVAYEMFTGTVPFQAESPIGVLMKHVNDPLPVPAGNLLPSGVLRSLRQATAKIPDARCASAGAFVADLERAFNVPRSFASLAAIPVFARGFEKRAARWVAAATGVFATAALLAVVAYETPRAPEQTPSVRADDIQLPHDRASKAPGNGNEKDLAEGPKRGPEKSPAPTPPSPSPGSRTTPPEASEPKSGAGLASAGTTQPPEEHADVVVNDVSSTPPLPEPPAAAKVDTSQPPPDTIVKAVRLETVKPIYPAIAIAASIVGEVDVEATVAANGSVIRARVVRSDNWRLDEAARAAVMKYRYQPQMRNGTPELSTDVVTVSFDLKR